MGARNSQLLMAAGLVYTAVLNAAPAQAADVRSAIATANAQMSSEFAKGDSAAVASLYTSDGEVLPVGSAPVKGSDAIQKFWQAAISSGIAGVTLTTVEVYPAGSTATEVGKYQLTDRSGKQLDHGKYIVIWRKVDNRWLLMRDMFSTDATPAK